jgi:ATP-dependent DNA ligase
MSRIVKRSASQAVKPAPSRRDVPLPQFVPFQLSRPVEKPPSGAQWVHEIKLDGYRMAARLDNGRVQLLTRTGLDWTEKYPSAIAALANMKAGMPVKVLGDLRRRLDPLARAKPPLSILPPRKTRFGSPLVLSRVHWVEPKLVVEITYLTWTADNLLRHTVYVGLREDKPADQVRLES